MGTSAVAGRNLGRNKQSQPGTGAVTLMVQPVLAGRFLKIAVTADYKNDRGGEHHEDFGFVSFDGGDPASCCGNFTWKASSTLTL